MTVAVFPIDVETTSLVDMLRGKTTSGVYRSGDVYKAGENLSHPYAELHRITDTLALPTMTEDGSGFRSVWQFDAAGIRQDQAEAFAVKLTGWLLASDGAGGWANTVTVASWGCIKRAQIADMGTTVEGQLKRKTWVCRRRFELVWDLA